MSKTRKFLTTLTMVAVATTTSLTAVPSAQAHPSGSPHVHAAPPGGLVPVPPGALAPVPGPLLPLPPGSLTPMPPGGGGGATPTPPPAHTHGRRGLRRGEAAALGVLGGVIIGSALANANRNRARPVQQVGLPAAHYAWCDAKYRSYVIATNTFTGYDGRQHYCISPYVQ